MNIFLFFLSPRGWNLCLALCKSLWWDPDWEDALCVAVMLWMVDQPALASVPTPPHRKDDSLKQKHWDFLTTFECWLKNIIISIISSPEVDRIQSAVDVMTAYISKSLDIIRYIGKDRKEQERSTAQCNTPYMHDILKLLFWIFFIVFKNSKW